jgi:hypothetical protein
LANRTDAQIHGQTLSESGELVRATVGCVRTVQCADLGGNVNDASRRALIVWFVSKSETFVLGPFTKTKGSRLPGRTPTLLNAKVKPQHMGKRKMSGGRNSQHKRTEPFIHSFEGDTKLWLRN